MVPPQSGQYQSAEGYGRSAAGEAVGCKVSAELWSKRKQSGRSVARCRLARKPKLRMRTKPRGSKCSRKRRRNSSTESVISRFVLVSRIPPAKRDLALGQGDEPVIGDGDAVGVSAEITQGMLGTTEGRFAIDHPVMPEQWAEPSGEDLGLSEPFQIAIEAELSFAAGALQRSHELTAKNSAQHLDGKKEASAGSNPVSVVEREPAGRHHTMDMGMMLEPLIPGVQHAEETDVGAQVSGIARNFEQGCGASAEQQVVDDLLVLQGEVCQFPRQSKNDM